MTLQLNPSDLEHLIAAPLELVRYLHLPHLVTLRTKVPHHRIDMGSGCSTQRKQGEYTHFSAHAAQFGNGVDVEREVETVAVEKQEMRGQRKTKAHIRKTQKGRWTPEDTCHRPSLVGSRRRTLETIGPMARSPSAQRPPHPPAVERPRAHDAGRVSSTSHVDGIVMRYRCGSV